MVSDSWLWNNASQYCGRDHSVLPYRPDLNNANKLRVVFRTNNDVNGDGFTVR